MFLVNPCVSSTDKSFNDHEDNLDEQDYDHVWRKLICILKTCHSTSIKLIVIAYQEDAYYELAKSYLSVVIMTRFLFLDLGEQRFEVLLSTHVFDKSLNISAFFKFKIFSLLRSNVFINDEVTLIQVWLLIRFYKFSKLTSIIIVCM